MELVFCSTTQLAAAIRTGHVSAMEVWGPLARTVRDLALLFSLIAGPDGRDPEVPPVPIGAVPEVALRNLRVAFAPTFPGFPVAAAVGGEFRRPPGY